MASIKSEYIPEIMRSFIQNIAQARALTIGLGLLATSVPVFAQATTAPATPGAPASNPVVPAPVAPVTDPQAKSMLDQVVARYGALQSLSVSDNDGDNTQLIQFKAPQTARVTTTNDKGKLVVLEMFTDTNRIVMQKPNDVFEYVSKPLPPIPAGQSARSQMDKNGVGGPVISSLLAGLNPFREDGPFKASSYTMGQPTMKDGLLLTPIVVTTAKPPKRPTDLTFTLFVNPKDSLIYRTEVEVKYPNGQKQMFIDTFQNIQADTDIPTTTFVFTPPAGATKVTDFSDPVVRVKAGTLPFAVPAGTKDTDGKDFSFDQFKGKVTLVDFWATWCGPCKAELPNVKANYAKYHNQGFDIVGISLDHNTSPLAKFIKSQNMPWRQVWDGFWSGPIADSYNVKSIPRTILIGKDGKIIATGTFEDNGTPDGIAVGPIGKNLEPAIKAALAAN